MVHCVEHVRIRTSSEYRIRVISMLELWGALYNEPARGSQLFWFLHPLSMKPPHHCPNPHTPAKLSVHWNYRAINCGN